jgi:hypothetical protein
LSIFLTPLALIPSNEPPSFAPAHHILFKTILVLHRSLISLVSSHTLRSIYQPYSFHCTTMLSFAVLALASLASSANALVVPRSNPPSGYAVGYLEDYTTYHTRYLALNCQGQHGSSFFDDCCHPMLAVRAAIS